MLGERDLSVFGWAPGAYMGAKCACGKEFGGADARAWRCKPCAVLACEAAARSWPVGCHDTASCERSRICMYHQCVHTGKGAALGAEIDAAITEAASRAMIGGVPSVFGGKKIDEMTRDEAIAALKVALTQWADANRRTIETHEFYREMMARRLSRPLPQDNEAP